MDLNLKKFFVEIHATLKIVRGVSDSSFVIPPSSFSFL